MIKMKLHIKLAEYRLTQTEFAKKIGIRQPAVSAYCNDNFKTISKEHLDKMCQFFNCTPNDLIEFTLEDDIKKSKEKVVINIIE